MGCTNVYEAIPPAQNPLFIESLEEAIAALAPVVGGKKKLAALLRPDLEDSGTAHKWLLEWLSEAEDRRAVFHAKHLILAIKIAAKHDVHFIKHWLDRSTGYVPTGIAPIKTNSQKRAERMGQITAEYKRLADEDAADREQQLKELRRDLRAIIS
jgi:hypothetical protein